MVVHTTLFAEVRVKLSRVSLNCKESSGCFHLLFGGRSEVARRTDIKLSHSGFVLKSLITASSNVFFTRLFPALNPIWYSFVNQTMSEGEWSGTVPYTFVIGFNSQCLSLCSSWWLCFGNFSHKFRIELTLVAAIGRHPMYFL